MTYQIIQQDIPQHRRKEINDKVIFCIDTDSNLLSPEAVFNCYTGIGGLHGLKQEDFASYYEYSEAKKKIELGQFFTPHDVCREMVDLISPDKKDLILDMCCGMGNFFNYMPNQCNCFGFDSDINAVKVAKYLYPEATIEQCDIRCYKPAQCYDIIIGNPPFNLEWEGKQSQFYYIEKASTLLVAAGFLLLVVPYSFIENEFWDKTKVDSINDNYSFIGQTKLSDKAFAFAGVEEYKTKVMVFMRKSCHIESQPYDALDFVSFGQLKERVKEAKHKKMNLRIQLAREGYLRENKSDEDFEYKLKKYLYEIKTHKHLRKYLDRSIALVSRFRNQKPPENCSYEEYKEWEEKKKLSPENVLKYIYRFITEQNIVPRKEVALVKTSYSFKLKAYAPRMLSGIKYREAKIYDLVLGRCILPEPREINPSLQRQYKAALKFINRKKRDFDHQSRSFADMENVPDIERYIESLNFINKERECCQFTRLQKQDLGLVLQKRYSLLNWQQGSGKTAAVYHYAKYLLKFGKVRNAIILAPAIAINLTWIPFLTCNKEKFYVLKSWRDFKHIPENAFLVISISMVSKLKWYLSRFIKNRSRKLCLIFDESDEITNPKSKKTEVILELFRRLKFKILATGTTTRNNINELYSQFNLLYNNSLNFMCWCGMIYHENKEKVIVEKVNRYFGMPFPQQNGETLFKSCFSPGKVSVFGIEKQNQDIYNQETLEKLINKTIKTRKFREFAGEKFSIITHTVKPAEGERAVYKIIAEEFYRIYKKYFNSSGDSRKEAGLKLMRQIKLLIRACSAPNQLEGYFGNPFPNKAYAIKEIVKSIPGLVAVGCTGLNTLDMYADFFKIYFPDRPLFIVKGDIAFDKRQMILDNFQQSIDGILLCTQQSLKSSANIPQCNDVILESMQWNIPKMEQFYFRFIRLDSKSLTRVHYVTYEDSIEQNLMALVLTKERLNEFIKSGRIKEQSEIFDEFNISMSVIDSLLKREQDRDGSFHLTWGSQRIA